MEVQIVNETFENGRNTEIKELSLVGKHEIEFMMLDEPVRAFEVDGIRWVVAKDACEVLGLNPRDSVRYLDDDEKAYVPRKHLGLMPGKQMLMLSESGFYSLIFQSRKPAAIRFQDWVCDEVLPSIRKHGAYMTESILEQTLENPDFLIELATRLKKDREVVRRGDEMQLLTLF